MIHKILKKILIILILINQINSKELIKQNCTIDYRGINTICKHESICINSPDSILGYECKCEKDYYGFNCGIYKPNMTYIESLTYNDILIEIENKHLDKSFRSNKECKNDGHLINDGALHGLCDCPNDYYGRYCEKRIHDRDLEYDRMRKLSAQNCLNGGTWYEELQKCICEDKSSDIYHVGEQCEVYHKSILNKLNLEYEMWLNGKSIFTPTIDICLLILIVILLIFINIYILMKCILVKKVTEIEILSMTELNDDLSESNFTISSKIIDTNIDDIEITNEIQKKSINDSIETNINTNIDDNTSLGMKSCDEISLDFDEIKLV